MKKRLLFPACLVCITLFTQAQTDPPKPPPPPPEPPKIEVVHFDPPVITKDNTAQDFFKKNPSIKGINRNGDRVVLLMKDKKTEKYNLANEEENKAFTKKYGVLPDPPPPPEPPQKEAPQFAPPVIMKDKPTPPPPPPAPVKPSKIKKGTVV